MSRCQEMVPGASVLLGMQKKFTSGQVKSRGRNVISGDSGGDCCRGGLLHSLCARHGSKCVTGMGPSYPAAVL